MPRDGPAKMKREKSAENNHCEDGKANSASGRTETESDYHRRLIDCCNLDGLTEAGGLLIRIPVLGFTMGIAFLIRVAAGWCILRVVG